MLNNIINGKRVELMARKQNLDDVWEEIFDSLVLENEPPFEYIKNATIITKAGLSFKVTATDFAQILERERYLSPEESEILSCRLAINFNKVRKDVDDWASQMMLYFDNQGIAENKTVKNTVKKSKPAAKAKTVAKKQVKKPAKIKKTVSSKNSKKS